MNTQYIRKPYGWTRLPAVATALLATAMQPLEAADQSLTLRVATVAPRGSSFHKSFQDLGEKWRSAPGGGVKLDIYPGTQGGEPTIVRRMNPRVRQLDGAVLTAVGLGQIDRSVTALQFMPMMFHSWKEVDFARERLQPRLERILYDKGYMVLFWADAGWVRWFSKSPIIRPSDLKHMNVFASSGAPESVELMKSFYNPVVLEPDKILNSLQTDMINTVPIPPFLANFLQVGSYTGNMLDLNYVPIVGAMVVTRRAWEQLPAETRVYLAATARESGAEIRRNSRKEDADAIDAMREKQHLIVHPLSPDVEQEWRDGFANLYPQVRGKVVPAEMFDEVVRALEDYRAGRTNVVATAAGPKS